MISGVLLDLAGVVYSGDATIAGSVEAIERLRSAGLPIRFVSNTTRASKIAVVEKLSRLGIDVKPGEVFTPAAAAIEWLRTNRRSAHLLIHPDLAPDFADVPAFVRKAVVIGDAGDGFDYQTLNAAFRCISEGAELIALARNRVIRDADGKLSLDAGAFVAALEYAAETEAVLLGKPAPAFFRAALAGMNCAPVEAVMVGDDAESDVAGALAARLGAALLVRTGKYRHGDEARFDPAPTAVVGDLAAAADWILSRPRS